MEAGSGRGALPKRGQLSDFSWAHPHPWRGAPGCVSGGGSGLSAVGFKLQAAPTAPASGWAEAAGPWVSPVSSGNAVEVPARPRPHHPERPRLGPSTPRVARAGFTPC